VYRLSRSFGSTDQRTVVATLLASPTSKAKLFDQVFVQNNGTEQPPESSDKERLLVFYDGM
jgi:hypothetical protein